MQKKAENDAGQLQQQYQYQKEETEQKQSVGNREFVFSFRGNQDVIRKLKTPRSRAYMEAISAIDMLSTTDEEIIAELKSQMDEETADEFSEMSTEELMEEIMLSIREELSEALEELKQDELLGIFTKCYITGCDVHAIDKEGNIIEHFQVGRKIPNNLERGRIVYHENPGCRCVEVYTNFCLVINNDSSVKEVRK